MEDAAPCNVVVERDTHPPRIIDLAQCLFRDELLKKWQEMGWHEDDDWDPDVEYWKQVDTGDNPEAIGVPIVHRVEREAGVKLDVKYPDCNAIIDRIKHSKAEAEGMKAG
jgi:hypothetical protein